MEESKAPKSPPVFLVNIANRIVEFLQRLQTKLLTPQVVLLNYVIGNVVIYRSVYVAAELKIADLLKHKPMTIDQLAKVTGTNSDSLLRIMRTLTSAGIFKAKKRGYFDTNRLGRYLQSDIEDSMYYFVKVTGSEWVTEIWSDLLETTKTGKDHYETKYGMDFFEWLRTNKDAQKLFNEGAGGISTISDKPIASAYAFSGFKTLIDLGGGKGSQIMTLLRTFPGLKCVLFELPLTIENIKKSGIHNKEEISGRLEYIAGDFLGSVPSGYDCYFMKSILHDFDDRDCIKILTNCREAIGNKATLLVVDHVMKEDYNVPDFSKVLDVNLAVLMGGKVRTKLEYANLLEKAAFELKREIFTASPFNILEARPV